MGRHVVAAQVRAAAAGQFAIGGDLPVNRLGFGALWMTGPDFWGEPERPDDCLTLLRELPALGVNLIDTADSYGPETSERLIREALHPYPAGMVVATKGGYVRPYPHAWSPVGRPEYLIQAAKLSARRLGIPTIDLWQLHRIDPATPRDEQFDAIARLRSEGVIRHVGLSEVSVDEIEAAQAYFPVATVQNLYNLENRASEAVLDYCEERNIGFMPWYPLGQGRLLRPGSELARLAAGRGASVSQIAIAWLLARSPVMLPIPGTGNRAHLAENVAAAAIKLSPDDLARIAEAARHG